MNIIEKMALEAAITKTKNKKNNMTPTKIKVDDIEMMVEQMEVPGVGSISGISFNVIFDMTGAHASAPTAKVIMGDVSKMLQTTDSNLIDIPAALVIDGDYQGRSVEILNSLAKSKDLKFIGFSAIADNESYFNAKPFVRVFGNLTESPLTKPYNINKDIGPEDQNLTARNDKLFIFDATPFAALQVKVPTGRRVSITFNLAYQGQ